MSNLLVSPLLEAPPDPDREFSRYSSHEGSENARVLKVGVGTAVLVFPVIQLPRLIRG